MAIMSFDYYSKARNGFVSCTAVLPVEKAPSAMPTDEPMYSAGPFPTIYLLHGYSGDQNDWLVRSRVEEWAMEQRFAVVMPYGANYFYLDNEDTGTLYGEFVGRELVEVTRNLFPLSRKQEDTVIGGLSMGGFGALRNGLKYAETFGAVIALSSALITDEISAMKEGERNAVQSYSYYRHVFGDLRKLPGSDKDPKHLAAQRVKQGGDLPRLFLACGTEDFLFQQNLDFHAHLEAIGYPHVWRQSPGVHDFDFWNPEIKTAMAWLKEARVPS